MKLLLWFLVFSVVHGRKDVIDWTPGGKVTIMVMGIVPPDPEETENRYLPWGGPAARLALSKLGERDDLFPDTTVELEIVDIDQGKNPLDLSMRLGKYLCAKGNKTAVIIGPTLAVNSEEAAYISSNHGINLVNPVSPSNLLSDRTQFPFVTRIWPSGGTEMSALVSMLLLLDWLRISIIASGAGLDQADALILEARPAGVEVALFQVPAQAVTYDVHLSLLKKHDARIMVLLVPNSDFPQLFMRMVDFNMFDEEQVAITPSLTWGSTGLIEPEYFPWFPKLLSVGPNLWVDDVAHRADFLARMSNITGIDIFGSGLVEQTTHDSTILAAYALHDFIQLKRFCDGIGELAAATLPNCTQVLLEGDDDISLRRLLSNRTLALPDDPLQGQPFFVTPEGSGQVPMKIVQIVSIPEPPFVSVNNIGSLDLIQGDWRLVEDRGWDWSAWEKKPVDRVTILYQTLSVSDTALGINGAFSALVLVMCIGFVVFTLVHADHSINKMSSYRINCLSALGASILTSTTFLGRTISSWGCTCHVWLLTLGFTLLFGPIVAKTWRVHVIFTSERSFQMLTGKDLSDYAILRPFFALLITDIAILLAWAITSPYTTELRVEDPISTADPNIRIAYQSAWCTSSNTSVFGAVILALNAALLIVGSLLSFRIRNVKLKALNDSTWIGLIVYTTTLVSIFAVPLAAIVDFNNVDAAFTFTSAPVSLVAAISMILLFLPKILGIIFPKRFKELQSTSLAIPKSSTKVNHRSLVSQQEPEMRFSGHERL